ncbi:SpoIIE family protein phosphatase [Streptomyces sp. 6N223]|uniref:SpoIIE family protein phosphatase n=1 Tax=Streptomyces sp. 6N223 TaxID=3457412 RepID=UPI003FD191E7
MHTEDVLAALDACRIGVWRWEGEEGMISLDAVAAELIGLPSTPVTVPDHVVRAHFHVADYVQGYRGMVAAAADGRVGEAELRVVAEDGGVVRTLRSRARSLQGGLPSAPGVPHTPSVIVGILAEAAEEEPPSAARPATPDAAEWRRAREAFLLDVGQALSEASTTREVLRIASSLAMPGFEPSATGVFSREGDHLRVIEYHTQHGDAERDSELMEALHRAVPLSRARVDSAGPPAGVMRTGHAVYLPSPADFEERYPEVWNELWPTLRRFGHQSWGFLPLTVAGRTIGVWLVCFDTRHAFTFEERALLSTIARQLAQALARAFLHDTERELTADLQHTMRPAPSPTVPGMRIAARYVPTGGGLRVGGDWYDVIPLPSGRVALIIGDVQGHDVRAAAIMAQLRIALRAYASEGHHPDGVLSRASRFLATLAPTAGKAHAEPDDRFATCLYVEVDPPSGTLDIARAGHPDPAMLLEDGTMINRPTAGGLPLGIDPAGDYPTTRLVLEPGETLLLCTDGLIEAGHLDVDAGWARLRKALAAISPAADLEDVADALIDTARRPGGVPDVAAAGGLVPGSAEEDDIALLLLERPETPATGVRGPVRRVVLTIAQSEPSRVAQARGQLDALLHDWKDSGRVYGAALMLSEVVTNVLTHTDGDALLVAELSGQAGDRLLRVEVTDPSDELPHRREPGELASSGRGLMLMESLADAWGVAPRGEGKTTWFELREGPPGL